MLQTAMSRLCCPGRIPPRWPTVSSCPSRPLTTCRYSLNTVPDLLKAAEEPINHVIDTVSKLSQAASKLPYYKFNNMWSRQMQGAVSLPINYHLVPAHTIAGRGTPLLGLAGWLQVRGW
jgi:hypothetical protein